MPNQKIILKNFTILYVEDELETHKLIVEILKKYFKDVFVAFNGKEGLELYNKVKPDIVLSDIVMPIMNGIEMSKQIKKLNPHQPIAIFTAFNDYDYLTQAINMGIDKFISKPLNSQYFFKALLSIAKVLQVDKDKEKFNQTIDMQTKVNAMSEMLNNIAHQWRQPLSSISTAASSILISKEFKLINETEETNLLENIVAQTQSLSKTIDEFKDFVKGDDQDQIQNNVHSIIRKVLDITQESFATHNIETIENIENSNYTFNQTQLLQTLLNIFHNTKDAFILQDKPDQRYLFIDTKEINGKLIITCQDNAGGVEDNIIDKVFEPFFTTKHQYYGTGLGLYMSYNIITKHLKGTIDISNKHFTYKHNKYYGVCISIVLPLMDTN